MLSPSPIYLVLFGAQGSGKGTQARLIQDRHQIPQVATGDLFRFNIGNQTELGKLAKGYIDRGELVPDSVTNDMVRDRISKADAAYGVVFDGYPRNIAQAKALEAMLAETNARISQAIYIKVEEDELMRRLTGRRVCKKCQATFHVVFNPAAQDGVCDRCGGALYQRDDDKNTDALQRRLQLYFEETMPVIEWYRSAALLAEVNGQQAIERVSQVIEELVSNHRPVAP